MVVLIIGILAAVAVPQYQKAVEKSKASQALSLLKSVVQASKVYYMTNGTYPTKFDEMDVDIPWTGTTLDMTYNPSIDHTDWKSNEDWSIAIYKFSTNYGRGIHVVRTSGKYKGAQFGYFFNRPLNDTPTKQIFCIEHPDTKFTAPTGSYCRNIMGGTPYNNSNKFYVLPW